MAKQRPELPDTVFVRGRSGNSHPHIHCVLKVVSKHEDGQPKELLLIRRDETVDLEQMEQPREFVTAYLPQCMIRDEI